jgi:hypothetical protein
MDMAGNRFADNLPSLVNRVLLRPLKDELAHALQLSDEDLRMIVREAPQDIARRGTLQKEKEKLDRAVGELDLARV